MKVVREVTNGVPIKMWLYDIEEGAFEQASNVARLPFVYKHVAIMPDAHQGYGMPIGGVMATQGVVVPNAVGVDIGCGMQAVRTSLISITLEEMKRVLGGSKEHKGGIRSHIPTGFNRQSKKQDESTLPSNILGLRVVCQEYESARKQVGTLGGGNHFIELQQEADGRIWVMIHSGSRNIGHKVATFYNNMAKEMHYRWHTSVDPKLDLAFLPMEADGWGEDYIREMQYCVDFAKANRSLMMKRVLDAVRNVFPHLTHDPPIDVPHNYASLENHFGQNVWVHRKGATFAGEGFTGIIPGSQGTSSYIVQGRGNPEAFNSCSHGAGRKMGRKQAQKTLDLAAEQAKLDEQGILHAIRGVKDLDEASGAYKDIDAVMNNQKDLVEIVVELKPLAVVKG